MQCISELGTGGCGFEQQLESPLKALSPKTFEDAAGNPLFNPMRFISTTESGTWGKGDVPRAQGGNLGFLRPDTDASPSLVVVVAVTDEDDKPSSTWSRAGSGSHVTRRELIDNRSLALCRSALQGKTLAAQFFSFVGTCLSVQCLSKLSSGHADGAGDLGKRLAGVCA